MGAQPLSGWDGLDMMGTEFDVPVPGIPGIGNFSFFWWYRNRYRKKLVPEKSLGTGIGRIWYRKKSRNRYRKNLVPEKSLGTGIGRIWYRKKVSEPVSEKFGTGNVEGISGRQQK